MAAVLSSGASSRDASESAPAMPTNGEVTGPRDLFNMDELKSLTLDDLQWTPTSERVLPSGVTETIGSWSGGVWHTFDITGTMWIVSLLFVLGMRSMWIHWMWGFMMGAFFMAYMGKWVRRSNVMTAAEWMVTRFGTDGGGRVARTSYALMAVITLTSFVGYAFQGIGKFSAVYIPLPPGVSAIIVIGTTTLYVILGGLYSVVITQVIQTLINERQFEPVNIPRPPRGEKTKEKLKQIGRKLPFAKDDIEPGFLG